MKLHPDTRNSFISTSYLRGEVFDPGDVLQRFAVPSSLSLLRLEHRAVGHVHRVPIQHTLQQRQTLVETFGQQNLRI